MLPPLIILIGLRASGKSTVGRRLAGLMGRRFIELDDLTAARAGQRSAGEALRSLGEAGFRLHEFESLKALLEGSPEPAVVALGGGTPTAPGAAGALGAARDNGLAMILYLNTPPDRLIARLMTAPGDRPSLTGAEMTAEVHSLYKARHDLYQSLADHVVVSRHNDPDQTAESIRLSLTTTESGL